MLTTTILDRTIFEAIRLEVVEAGYLADWRTTPGADIATRQNNWNAANDAIRVNMGGIIEVYGVGSGESRGTKDYNRITVDREAITEGTVNNVKVEQFEKQPDGSFTKFEYPNTTVTITYEVRYFSQKTSWERRMYEAISKALGKKKQMKGIDDAWAFTGDTFYIKSIGYNNVSSADWVEWVAKFDVIDVYIDEPEILQVGIPPLTEIQEDPITIDDIASIVGEEFKESSDDIITFQ